jgi:hypothetical protein
MLEIAEKTNELKTISIEKDTWVLEVPLEVCKHEGFAEGTLISLTLKNNSISGVYLNPSQELDDFVNQVAEDEKEYFEEMKRIGD